MHQAFSKYKSMYSLLESMLGSGETEKKVLKGCGWWEVSESWGCRKHLSSCQSRDL